MVLEAPNGNVSHQDNGEAGLRSIPVRFGLWRGTRRPRRSTPEGAFNGCRSGSSTRNHTLQPQAGSGSTTTHGNLSAPETHNPLAGRPPDLQLRLRQTWRSSVVACVALHGPLPSVVQKQRQLPHRHSRSRKRNSLNLAHQACTLINRGCGRRSTSDSPASRAPPTSPTTAAAASRGSRSTPTTCTSS